MILYVIGISILFSALQTSISKVERAECERWQYNATQYDGYFLIDWQKAQCKNYNIKVGK